MSVSGMCPISNQPVAGSMIVNAQIVLSQISFVSGFLVLIEKGPMQSTHTVCHGLNLRSLGGNLPYFPLVRFAIWHSLQVVHNWCMSLDIFGQ